MGRGGEVLPSRDSTRIARTHVLTLQRYELILIFANNSKDIFSFHIILVLLQRVSQETRYFDAQFLRRTTTSNEINEQEQIPVEVYA